jgi:hypothetical protein
LQKHSALDRKIIDKHLPILIKAHLAAEYAYTEGFAGPHQYIADLSNPITHRLIEIFNQAHLLQPLSVNRLRATKAN